jgi:hypothetical protein
MSPSLDPLFQTIVRVVFIEIPTTAIGVLNYFHSSQLVCFLFVLGKSEAAYHRQEKRRNDRFFQTVVLPTRKCR